MTLTKNPVFLAVLATCVVFAVTYYYYNYYSKPVPKKDDKKNSKKKSGIEINETIIVSSLIAGLITWYIASSYFTNDKTINEGNTNIGNNGSLGGGNPVEKGLRNMEGGARDINGFSQTKVPRLDDSEDVTRSYNLIGSGVNIPRADLKIPSVFIDYK